MDIQQYQVVGSLGKIPLLNSAYSQLSAGYTKVKSSSGLANSLCSTAESTVVKALPYVEKYQPQLHKADEYAVGYVDKLINYYPAVQKTPEELKLSVSSTVDGVRQRVVAVKDKVVSVPGETVVKSRQLIVTNYQFAVDRASGIPLVQKAMNGLPGQYVGDFKNKSGAAVEDFQKKLKDYVDWVQQHWNDNRSFQVTQDLIFQSYGVLLRTRTTAFNTARNTVSGFKDGASEYFTDLRNEISQIHYVSLGSDLNLLFRRKASQAGALGHRMGQRFSVEIQHVQDSSNVALEAIYNSWLFHWISLRAFRGEGPSYAEVVATNIPSEQLNNPNIVNQGAEEAEEFHDGIGSDNDEAAEEEEDVAGDDEEDSNMD